MSYEGYYQRICANGHYREHDCYMMDDDDRCSNCGAAFVANHSVDTTNDEGHPFELELVTPEETHTCSCGDVHRVKEATYRFAQSATSQALREGTDGQP